MALARARRLLARFGGAVPLRCRGALVALVAGLALWRYGYGALDLVVFVLGVSGLVLAALCAFAVAAAAAWHRRLLSRRPPPADVLPRRLETGVAVPTGFCLPSPQWLPLVKLRWIWLNPCGVECSVRSAGDSLEEVVEATRRCEVTSLRRRFFAYDAFGLASVAWERAAPAALTILPNPGLLRHMPALRSLAAGEGMHHEAGAPEGDRMEFRRYVPGDPVRNIMWKSYARTRQLNVRTPERSVDHARKIVGYLVAGPFDEPAAAAARVALESGALGDRWLFGADGTEAVVDQLDAALQVIARSGSAPEGATGLGGFLQSVGVGGAVHCIVFAPGRPGPWTPEVLRVAREHPEMLTFVLGVDGLVRARPAQPLWRRFVWSDEPAPGVPIDEVAELLLRLGGGLVADRTTGRTSGTERHRALETAA